MAMRVREMLEINSFYPQQLLNSILTLHISELSMEKRIVPSAL
jgi:hypothetical protein